MSTTTIYIIRLEGGRYYVGKTNNLEKRKQQHLNGTASAWTRKYKPISFEKIIPNASHFDEDKYTKEYMSKYGIDRVRGGSYVEIELDDSQKETLNREIWGAKDLCKQCGRPGHFVKDCHAKTDASGNKIHYEDDADEWGCEYCDRTFTTAFGCGVHEKSCKEKSKKTHYVKPTTTKKDDRINQCISLPSHKAPRMQLSTKAVKEGGTCYRCGRTGHYSPDCYATTHHRGYTLDSDCESTEDSDCESTEDSD